MGKDRSFEDESRACPEQDTTPVNRVATGMRLES